MHVKRFIQIDAKGRCYHEVEYLGEATPQAPAGLMDVTARTDGPWLGKVYDKARDTFAWPEPQATLTADPQRIAAGGKAVLRWGTADAVSAEINHGVGAVEPAEAGEIQVSPTRTTTYTLTAVGREGTTPAKAKAKVTV